MCRPSVQLLVFYRMYAVYLWVCTSVGFLLCVRAFFMGVYICCVLWCVCALFMGVYICSVLCCVCALFMDVYICSVLLCVCALFMDVYICNVLLCVCALFMVFIVLVIYGCVLYSFAYSLCWFVCVHMYKRIMLLISRSVIPVAMDTS